jgi:hypothetical protein
MHLLLMYTQFWNLCMITFYWWIFQQSIAICNKYTSVPLTDAHLQRTCLEILHLQTQFCDHILNNTRRGNFVSEIEYWLQQKQQKFNLYPTEVGI